MKELVQKGALETDTLLLLWEARTEGFSAVGVELDQALTEKAMETPEAAEDIVLRIARGSAAPFRVAPSPAVLSVLAKATSPAHVWGLVENWPRGDLRLAMHCMDWGGDTPEPLVRLYLLSDRLRRPPTKRQSALGRHWGSSSAHITLLWHVNSSVPEDGKPTCLAQAQSRGPRSSPSPTKRRFLSIA